MSKKISAILFSGGLDSSLAVCDMIEKGYDVHLLHYDTGALISNNLIKIRYAELKKIYEECIATVYKGNIIKNLIMDCQSYTKYRPNETTGGIFVSWRRKEELPTGA